MDRLTELFANKPMSYPGEGIAFNGDARGNGVSSTVGDVEVIQRFMQSDVSGAAHPFRCPSTANGTITPTLGQVNGNTVTGSPSVSASGTQVVYIRVTVTLNVTAQGYIQSTFASETAWEYQVGASVPANTTGYIYTAVATYVDGVKTVQSIDWHQRLRPKDDGTGTTTLDAIWWPT